MTGRLNVSSGLNCHAQIHLGPSAVPHACQRTGPRCYEGREKEGGPTAPAYKCFFFPVFHWASLNMSRLTSHQKGAEVGPEDGWGVDEWSPCLGTQGMCLWSLPFCTAATVEDHFMTVTHGCQWIGPGFYDILPDPKSTRLRLTCPDPAQKPIGIYPKSRVRPGLILGFFFFQINRKLVWTLNTISHVRHSITTIPVFFSHPRARTLSNFQLLSLSLYLSPSIVTSHVLCTELNHFVAKHKLNLPLFVFSSRVDSWRVSNDE